MTCAAASALQKAKQGLNGLRFPRNVFSGSWDAYLFFDSDWIFDERFVGYVKELLALEGAACACLLNLDSRSDDDAIYIDDGTQPCVYRSKLQGTGPQNGWLYDIGRFACTSNDSSWFIYCERSAEIGVIAMRDRVSPETCAHVLSEIKAVDIESAILNGISFGFSSAALSKDWTGQLLREYKSPH